MSQSAEKELDLLIDSLNQERQPGKASGRDTAELLAVVRAVKSLGRPADPGPALSQRVYTAAADRSRRRRFLGQVTALAAGLLLFTLLAAWTGLFQQDAVLAMEKAVGRLSSYQGVIEVRSRNAAGEEWLVRTVELWSEGDRYATRQDDGTLTVNNGGRRWQVRPQEREVALLPLVPDNLGSGFDLRDEAERARRYPHTVNGEELVAGRKANRLQISPPGGLPYYLWIDVETNLPLQLQTAMHNALQTTYTFVSFQPEMQNDADIFTYAPPDGYRVVEQDPGQLVTTVAEAAAVSGLEPLLPQASPARIFAFEDSIALDYRNTVVIEAAASGSFEPRADAAIGTAAGGPLEVWGEWLRWRQGGIEIRVQGPRRVELARQLAPDLALPDVAQSLADRAEVRVPVDMEIVAADQRQVDGGHGPWRLDPLQVTLTFVNLKVSPEGIVGEPEIPMSSLSQEANNGVEAAVSAAVGPVAKVYLKRLIRQDETGIWSVIGYDPR